MGRSYFTEVGELAATYGDVVGLDHSAVAGVASLLHGWPTVFVGTGGTFALASLAATEHTRRTGQVSVALTPMQAAADLTSSNCAVVLFSARSRHPDIRIAAQALRSVSGPVVLATQRTPDELAPRLVEAVDHVVTLGAGPTDGFLATNSLLAMATAWLRGTGHDLPPELPSLASEAAEISHPYRRVVILYGVDHRATATDLEARFSESGVAHVQVSDPRNFAHGRHFGFGRDAASCSLVTIAGPESAGFVDKTTINLVEPAQHVALRTALPFPAGSLDTLAAGMKLFARYAAADGTDPGKPHVGDAGRRLYAMAWSPPSDQSKSQLPEGVRRKLRAARSSTSDAVMTRLYTEALAHWHKRAEQVDVAGIVLDYDGTCCTTEGRREPPPIAVQRQLRGQIEAGMRVGFATGRGKSILEALRKWIPSQFWPQIYVAMYGGGQIQTLDHDFNPSSQPHPLLSDQRALLDPYLTGMGCVITDRPNQITIEPASSRQVPALAAIAQAIGHRTCPRDVQVTASGHSVDLTLVGAAKLDIASAMGVSRDQLVAVGDRGEDGGNDFDLLARAAIGLSVDQVSADPYSCWNIAPLGCRGPDALALYLQSLHNDGDSVHFRWTMPTRRSAERT